MTGGIALTESAPHHSLKARHQCAAASAAAVAERAEDVELEGDGEHAWIGLALMACSAVVMMTLIALAIGLWVRHRA